MIQNDKVVADFISNLFEHRRISSVNLLHNAYTQHHEKISCISNIRRKEMN